MAEPDVLDRDNPEELPWYLQNHLTPHAIAPALAGNPNVNTRPAKSITGAPPVGAQPPPSITGAPAMPPAPAPDVLGATPGGPAPIAGPNAAQDALAGNVAPPQWKDFRPQHVSAGRRIAGALVGGLEGLKNPQAGGETARSIAFGPQLEKYGEAKQEYGDLLGQGERAQKSALDEANIAHTGAETGELNARADAEKNPQPKPKEEEWSVVPGIQGPNGEAVQQEKNSGQVRVVGTAGVKEKPEKTPTENEEEKAVSDYLQGKGMPDTPANRTAARQALKEKPQQEPGSYLPVPDPTDPIHKIIGWVDPKSGHFKSLASIPGMSGNNEIKPTGQAASREEQASVIGRAGDGLISSIQGNRKQLGNVDAIIKSAFLGTPLADPKQAELATEIASFAALQPAMHGFRGTDALKQFEKIIGGIPNNPDALIASIHGIQKTAGYFNPNSAAKPEGPRMQQNSKGQFRYSTDGGKTWQAGKPPKQ